MGMPTASIAENPQQQVQRNDIPQPMGKGSVTYPSQSGQPQFGQPNQYSNTIGQNDLIQIQPQRPQGKGKGA